MLLFCSVHCRGQKLSDPLSNLICSMTQDCHLCTIMAKTLAATLEKEDMKRSGIHQYDTQQILYNHTFNIPLQYCTARLHFRCTQYMMRVCGMAYEQSNSFGVLFGFSQTRSHPGGIITHLYLLMGLTYHCEIWSMAYFLNNTISAGKLSYILRT